MKLPIPESYWVEENRFLAGEYPASYNPETARKRIESFLDFGIRAFIDLTQSHELVSYEGILIDQAKIYDLQLTYHRFAIRDHGVPSQETMKNILDTIDDEIQNNRPVYVHCWGGVGRTGITVACYLIRRGLAHEQALQKVHTLFKTRPQNYYSTSPETQIQFDFVRNWKEIPIATYKSQQKFCEG
jgi:protein-tyrosine phosphatase